MNLQKLKSLPPVSEMMRAAGLEPKKSLGQNFLFDLNLTRKIARSVPGIENRAVLEVGPGPGGLTRALLECGAKKVIAIEKDRAAKPVLDEIAAAAGGRLDVIYGDALKIKYDELDVESDGVAICSNLPYNIGTELLVKWLHQFRASDSPQLAIESMTLMFQREVAERIIAKAGDKQYGRLSVLTALTAKAKILFDVPNTAFSPPPKVRSAVVQIMPLPHIADHLSKIEKLTALLFGRRRKMIRGILPDVDWTELGLTGAERAEDLSPDKFAELANIRDI
jgi:16S rRNA (adenine1518-N6/adenine1519-N6)-dimethyltransferase